MKKTERVYQWDTLSGRLRYLMRELGMKQTEFAAACGVSTNYISMLVTGRRTGVSEPLCRLICQKYNVNPDWLRTGLGHPYADQEAIEAARLREELSERIDALDSVTLRNLLEVLQQGL